jgi:hypothetical protein
LKLKSTIQHNLILLPGWRTKRKIVVIESDDWGTIRMPDAQTITALSKKNPTLINDPYSRYDSLESNDDLSALFDVLNSVRDIKQRPCILTANTIVANPDFDKIAAYNYQEYAYEKFTDTLKRYTNCDRVTNLISEGAKEELYKPQFHGREHLNVSQWMKALQNGHTELLEAFKHRAFGIALADRDSKRKNLMSAFDYDDAWESEKKKEIIYDGLNIFEEIFGFKSHSFIATTFIWDLNVESALHKSGVKYLQGIPYQYLPNPGGEWYNRKFHFTGQKNKIGQIYLVRNAFFEPSIMPQKDNVGECMKRIELAFQWGKPAIIGSHRVNFIGSIEESNRSNNLVLFKKLLKAIVSKWPNVEFMSSDQLGNLINTKKGEQIANK